MQLCPFFISRCATMPYSPSRESKFFHLCSNVFSSFRKIKYSNKATRASQDLKSNSQENVRFSDSFWLEPQAHNLPFFDTPIACHVLLSETGASRGASHRSLRLSRLAARGQRFSLPFPSSLPSRPPSETGASQGASHRSCRLSRLAARGQRFTRRRTPIASLVTSCCQRPALHEAPHTDRVACHV